MKLSILIAGFLASSAVIGGEEWTGRKLYLYGAAATDEVFVKRIQGDSVGAEIIHVGNEKGSARLEVIDSDVKTTGIVTLGNEASPGYVNLTSTLVLENSTLDCENLRLGYNIAGSQGTRDGQERIQAFLNEGSLLKANYVQRYCKPWSRLQFNGGRIAFKEGQTEGLFYVRGKTYGGEWPNYGMTVEANDGPIDVELVEDRKLVTGTANRSVFLEGKSGLVKRGTGTLVWGWFNAANDGAILGDATYSGDTEIREGGIRLATPVAKSVRVSIPEKSTLKVSSGAFFDFAGTDAAFAGVAGAGLVTNSSVTAATLTLGESNAECVFGAGAVGGFINLKKVGAGILTVTAPQLPGTLTVSEGVLKVARGTNFAVDRIEAAPGTTVDLRGAQVICGEIDLPKGVVLLVDGETSLSETIAVAADGMFVGGRFAHNGIVRKVGEGTATVYGPCPNERGLVCIDEGRLVCAPAATFPGKYYRVNYTFNARHWQNADRMEFSEFSLYGISGARINEGGFTYNPIRSGEVHALQYGGYDGIDDARVLGEREVAVWMPNHNSFFNYDDAGSPLSLFDGDPATRLRNTSYWNSGNYLVFRLEDAAEDAVGFTFTTSADPTRRPTEWTVDGSVDGVTWVNLATHKFGSNTDEAWNWRTNSTPDTARTEYNDGFPYLFESLSSDGYKAFGNASVAVAKGAVLDVTSDVIRLHGLTVDLEAGAGSITRFVPAPNGVLSLVNKPKSTHGDIVIPLILGSVSDHELLKTWSVVINGEMTGRKVKYRDGSLVVPGDGLILIFK